MHLKACRGTLAPIRSYYTPVHGGWLATIAYRRAIDDVRSAQPGRHAAAGTDHGDALRDGRYERDVDDEIGNRQKYHQWLMRAPMIPANAGLRQSR